ncbi:MAG TPA: hypothetical protein VFT06_10345 [Flavisolibacter sp.]|nr:hypothetical protein [Flavisolibacter sp.]
MALISGLRPFYSSPGVVNFIAVQSIPLYGRIPNLTHVYGTDKVHVVVLALLKRFNDDLNLVRPMTAEQLDSCAWELIMTSEEDQLAIEDYVLFFKGALQGKYGRILDRLDQQTVFTLLEEYREQRWQALQAYKLEQHENQKGQGPSERSVQRNELAEQMANIAGRLGDVREKLKEQREINRATHFNKQMGK